MSPGNMQRQHLFIATSIYKEEDSFVVQLFLCRLSGECIGHPHFTGTWKKRTWEHQDHITLKRHELLITVVFPFGDLPEELIVHILTFVPAKDIILNLRRVCKSWKVIIDSKSLWIAKCHRDNVALPPFVLYDETLPIDFKKLCVPKPFNRNLLYNWDGAGKLEMAK